MKKQLTILTLAALMASCTSDVYTGVETRAVDTTEPEPAAIIIDGQGANAQSATRVSGQGAADLLGGSFRVYGTNDGGLVFNNYQICWTGTPGSTPSNTEGWEYQGYMSLATPSALQGIKFWDESSSRYDFVAFAGLADSQKIQSVSTNTFTVDTASMQHFYMANRVSAARTHIDGVKGVSPEFFPYQEPMKFVFKRIAARMRVGFYETIPGYAVTNLRFYYDDNVDAPRGTSTKDVLALTGQFPTEGDFTITYNADNVAHTALNANGTMATHRTLGTLDYRLAETHIDAKPYLTADGQLSATGDKAFLGDNSAKVIFALSDETIDGTLVTRSQWHPILPFEGNDATLRLRVDYTLVALDGSKETIHVSGAEAQVPVEHCKWQPNYSYTYIFKITNKTGYTSDTSPEGLYPITFDAVVVETSDSQESEHP